MTAQQINATRFNPNQLSMTKVATYERVISASIERVWENVLDWEHLPHLHATSFSHISLDNAGQWGWRTWSSPDRKDHVELTIASEDSYVARSYQSGRQISEIWTTLTPENDAVHVEVAFYLPDVSETDREKLGQLMIGLYTNLWDEDEQMMQARQHRLVEQRSAEREINLGCEPDIRKQLTSGEPLTFQLGKREFHLRLSGHSLIVHQSICPHLLGPLEDFDDEAGVVRCPWHGYRFDVSTGECVSPETASCSLGVAPELHVIDEQLIARLR